MVPSTAGPVGGNNLHRFRKVAANSKVRHADSFGVLLLTLHPGSYDWRFVPSLVAGSPILGRGPAHKRVRALRVGH